MSLSLKRLTYLLAALIPLASAGIEHDVGQDLMRNGLVGLVPTNAVAVNETLLRERIKRAQFNPHEIGRRKHDRLRRGPSMTTTTSTATSTSTSPAATCSANSGALGPAVKSCSSGGGSDSCTPPYYTVSADGVTLGPGYTYPANGHVNFQVIDCKGWNGRGSYLSPQPGWTTYSGGINFEIQGKPGYKYVGTNYFPFSGATSGSLPSGGYCVTWVQVGQFNQHFGEGGQLPICTSQCCTSGSAGSNGYASDGGNAVISSTTSSQASATPTPTTSSAPRSTSTSSTSTSSASAAQGTCAAGQTPQNEGGQCGGKGWSGTTCCKYPFTCVSGSDWYSQCQWVKSGSCTNDRYSQCGGKNWSGATCCPPGNSCVWQNDYYSQCLIP